MKKKYTVMSFGIIVALLLFSGCIVYKNHLRSHDERGYNNVFDHMYYTRVHTDFDWGNPGEFKGDFTNMKQLEGISRDKELSYTQMGFFTETYKDEYLDRNMHLSIYFNSKEATLEMAYYSDFESKDERYHAYVYNVNTKTLEYRTDDSNDTDKSFLYDILLKDWFDANPNTSFSPDNLGEFEMVDGY